MISLDKKILDPTSAVAKRMVGYGQENELFILIPHSRQQEIVLSPTVRVYSTGGNKIQQYFRLKKMGLKLIQENKIRFITVQDPSFSGNVGLWLKKKTMATLEIQLHGDFYGSDFYKRNLKDLIAYFLFGKRNIRRADKVRVVGERINKSLSGLGVEKQKVYVKPIPIFEGDRLVTRQQRDIKLDFSGFEKYFLFAGRLEDVKGIGWLIEIFDLIVNEYGRKFFLFVLGEGSQRAALEKIVNEKKLDGYLRFKGWTDTTQQYYKSVDCVLYPSQSEGYGLVPLEAVAAGTKVIMTDVGGANYELKPSDRVQIVPVGDKEAFIMAMLKI